MNQVKQKLHLVGYLLIRYFKDARYHEHKIHGSGCKVLLFKYDSLHKLKPFLNILPVA